MKWLVVQIAGLGFDHAAEMAAGLTFRPLRPVFPALTCPAQATLRTARLPGGHGVAANGFFDAALSRAFFWEQSARLARGPRIWEKWRAAGRRVGLFFWQQSLGESADLILSPKPVHKHHGGMIQDCYSQPESRYAELCAAIGRPFPLHRYWGPLADAPATEWIVAATEITLARADAPELLLVYLPHLDYDGQRHGPDGPAAALARARLRDWLGRLAAAARPRDYELLVFSDYALEPVTDPPLFPNRRLREQGWFATRAVGGRDYPDLYAARAFALADHAVAFIHARDETAARAAYELFSRESGIGEILDRAAQRERGLGEHGVADLLLVAAPGRWFAYPWWSDPRAAPDYATHVDIHNKPGYDPAELFWGWPPGAVSRDPARVRGTHGAVRPDRPAAWATTRAPEDTPPPTSLPELAAWLRAQLDAELP